MTTLTSNPSILNTQPAKVVMTNPAPVEPPSAWMQYGTSPTEIILATAVVIGAIRWCYWVNCPTSQGSRARDAIQSIAEKGIVSF